MIPYHYDVPHKTEGSEYTTCDGLINNSGGQFPRSSLFEIADAGFPLDKLVVGKPGTPDDASGFIEPSVLAGCVSDAKDQGWNAGVMVWEVKTPLFPFNFAAIVVDIGIQWPDAPSSWIQTVRSQAFPLVEKGEKGSSTSSAVKKPKATSTSKAKPTSA